MRSLILLLLFGCGGRTIPDHPDPPSTAPPIATMTRAAQGPETALNGYVFDPALDCVARKLNGSPDPARYRNALPIECGTPLYVVDARVTTPEELASTVTEMSKRFTEPVPIAVGTSFGDHNKVMVVIAARAIELQPYKTGDRDILGTLKIKVAKMRAIVSRSSGVVIEDVEREGDAFRIAAPDGDADVELVLLVGTETGPLGHVRVGKGSALFGTKGSLVERVAAARKHVGLRPLATTTLAADACKPVPPQVAGVEVNDHSTCYKIPLFDARYLGDEVAYSPLMQENLLQRDAAVLQVGTVGGDVGFRLLRGFEKLSDAEGRAKVLGRLREKWPNLVENRTPKVREVLDGWAASGQPDETAAQFKAPLEAIAASWSTAPHYLVVLTTARELDGALKLIESDDPPKAVELEYTQVRDKRGEMRHLIAAIFAIP